MPFLILQAFVATGFNLVLSFDTFSHALHPPERRQIDFEKEPGKVIIRDNSELLTKTSSVL